MHPPFESQADVSAFLAKLKREGKSAVAFGCGLRGAELASLKVADLDFERGRDIIKDFEKKSRGRNLSP